jgi:hypothetical protein
VPREIGITPGGGWEDGIEGEGVFFSCNVELRRSIQSIISIWCTVSIQYLNCRKL